MFEKETIIKNGKPYLERWRILGYLKGHEKSVHYEANKEVKSKLPFRLFVHRFSQPDQDRNLHNHPWEFFVSLIIKGGYSEVKSSDSHTVWLNNYRAPSFNFVSKHEYHKIVYVKPGTITVVFSWGKGRKWGFLSNGRHIPWKEYLGVKDAS
jgi:hypothetical protein